jgi:hypothetical protein
MKENVSETDFKQQSTLSFVFLFNWKKKASVIFSRGKLSLVGSAGAVVIIRHSFASFFASRSNLLAPGD